MNYCRDCQHCGPLNFTDNGSDIAHCLRHSAAKLGISPVTGEPFRENTELFCELEREDHKGVCGPNAIYFLAKQTEQAG